MQVNVILCLVGRDFVCYTLDPVPGSLLLRCVFAEALAEVCRDAFLHDAPEKAR